MLKRNLIANMLGQGVVSVAGLVFVPFYIRYLGIESYGIIGFFAILLSVFNLLDFGMTPTLSRSVARLTGARDEDAGVGDLLRSIETGLVTGGVIIAVAVWAASGWLATSWLDVRTLPLATVAQTIAVMGAVAGFRLLEGPYRGVLIGSQRHVLLNLLSGGFALARGGGAVLVLAFVRPSIEAFFLWQLAIGLLQCASFAVCAYASLPAGARHGRFSVASLRTVQGFAGAMFAISIAGLILVNVDKMLLSKLLPLADFGYYMLASLAASTLFAVIYPIRQTWSPRLNQLHASGDEAGFVEAYHRGSALVSVLAGSVAFFVIVFADVALHIWTGNPVIVAHVTGLLRILLFANLLNGLVNMPMEAQFAHRWTRLALISELAAIVLIFPTVILVAPRFGSIGVAWSLVLLNLLYLTMAVGPMFARILKTERWTWLFADVLLPLAAAGVCALAVRQAFDLCPADGLLSWIVLIGGAGATLVGTALATPLVRRDVMGFVRGAALT